MNAGPGPSSNLVPANGINIHYLDWGGAGHPLVCLHGANAECHRWDTLAQLLLPDYRIIAPDLRGHGDSDKPGTGYNAIDFSADVEALADAIDLDRFSLMGHSLAVPIAAVYAALHSDRLRAVILVDMPFEVSPEFKAWLVAGVGTLPASFASVEEARQAVIDGVLKGTDVTEERIHERLGRLRQNAMGRWEWKSHLSAVTEALRLMPDRLWEYAQSIICPALVMRGARSVISHEEAVLAARSIKHSSLVEIADSGHDIMVDNPVAMASAVRDFLGDK